MSTSNKIDDVSMIDFTRRKAFWYYIKQVRGVEQLKENERFKTELYLYYNHSLISIYLTLITIVAYGMDELTQMMYRKLHPTDL